jgi:tellurite resistance protein
MFIEVLTDSEKAVFVAIARALIAADGELHAKEATAFSRVTRLSPLDQLPQAGEIIVPDGLFESDAARATLLLELCGIAAADGVVTGEERVILDSVADSLEAVPGLVEEYLLYAAELVVLLDRGTQLVAEGVR